MNAIIRVELQFNHIVRFDAFLLSEYICIKKVTKYIQLHT